MSEFKVYHTKSWVLNSNLHFNTEGYIPKKDDYELVALVNTDALGETFRLTNHIDVAWWENEEVEMVKESRSTSVGDVVEDENGKVWLCASVGWEEVKWEAEEDEEDEAEEDKFYTDLFNHWGVDINDASKKMCTGCRQMYIPIMKDDDDCCPSCARF